MSAAAPICTRRPREVRGDGGPAHDSPRLGAFDRGDRAAADRRGRRLYFVVAQGRARQLDEATKALKEATALDARTAELLVPPILKLLDATCGDA